MSHSGSFDLKFFSFSMKMRLVLTQMSNIGQNRVEFDTFFAAKQRNLKKKSSVAYLAWVLWVL